MPLSFTSALDTHFGIHAPALQFRSERSRVLASNLSNADTPNFKARDIDFKNVLAGQNSAAGGVQMVTTHRAHLTVSGANGSARLMYRNPYQPTLDGNTVESEVEQANFARNAVQYQASLMFLTGKIRGLREAIQGGR